MPQAAFFSDQPKGIERVYGGGRREQLQIELDFYPTTITTENFDHLAPDLANLEFIFSTWGMPRLSTEQIQRMPALKVVFYAAGSVHSFAPPFLERGVQVVSAWEANGLPVAQFTMAQIILAAKGYFSAERACQTSCGTGKLCFSLPWPVRDKCLHPGGWNDWIESDRIDKTASNGDIRIRSLPKRKSRGLSRSPKSFSC